MSIKLYNGYILRGKTIEEMYPKLLEASDYVFSYLEREVLKAFLARLDEKGEEPSYRDIREELEKDSKTVFLDGDSSLVLLPNEGEVLVILYGGRKVEKLYRSKLPELEDYYYFDNTDRPRKIKAADWKDRKRRWGEATRDFRAPDRTGLTLNNSFFQVSYVTWCPRQETEHVLRRHFPEVDKE